MERRAQWELRTVGALALALAGTAHPLAAHDIGANDLVVPQHGVLRTRPGRSVEIVGEYSTSLSGDRSSN